MSRAWPGDEPEVMVISLARAWGRAGGSGRGWTVWFEMDAGQGGDSAHTVDG